MGDESQIGGTPPGEEPLSPTSEGETPPPGGAQSQHGDESSHDDGESSGGGAPAAKKKKDKKDKKGGSSRGVETMFRTSYRTHLDLSSLADNKANIMISINGIIISILLASIYPRITENRLLLLPTAVLLLACVLSLSYAVLAARPRVTRQNATLEDVRRDKANILFFGTFTNLGEEDFVRGMRELIQDPERAYGNMIRDIFGLGSVLETKYRLLRTSYTVFMLGLIFGVILFLAVFTWGSGTATGL